jgi:hypothetical protein
MQCIFKCREQIGINGSLRRRWRHRSDSCAAPDLHLLGLPATCGLSSPRGLRYPPVPTTPSSVRFIRRTFVACRRATEVRTYFLSTHHAQRMERFQNLSQVGPILMGLYN